jgi:hypothetical protein
MSYTCKYCNKTYSKESTLAAHLCEPKRRVQQESETGVQFGLRAYKRFYEMTQGSARNKDYADFCKSPYYNAFVKFGRYCVDIRAINFMNFCEWLLQNNKKIDHWIKDKLYQEWMLPYLKREQAQDALERGVKEMLDYCEEHPELKNGIKDYFRYANSNRICHHISTGRVSAWLVFNCDSGVDFLDTLNEEQLQIIYPYIDPEYWQRRFIDFVADTEWVKQALKDIGL